MESKRDAAQSKSQSGRLTAAEIAQKNGLSSYIMRTGEWIHDGRVIAAIDEALAQQKQEMARDILAAEESVRKHWQPRAESAESQLQRMKAVLTEIQRGGSRMIRKRIAALLTDAPAGTKEEDDEHLRS